MSIVKSKNFSYLRGPKGEKGDRGEPGSGVASATGRITYNSATKTIGFNEVGLATQNYVDISISNIINGAPGVLDTLQELALAINNDAQFFANITSTISAKLNKSGDSMTGFLTLHANPTSNLHAATKKYVDDTTSSITTADVPESGNLYFTTARARASISVSGDLSYNNGVISYTAPIGFSGNYNDLTNKPTIPSLVGYATESYVGTQIANLVDSAPTTLNTLNELSIALGNNANFATTITNELGNKVNSSSLATVATSGSYNDLTNKPTITTNINSLTDVDTTTNAPVVGNALIWNGTSWVPGASISAVLADASLDGGDY